MQNNLGRPVRRSISGNDKKNNLQSKLVGRSIAIRD